MNNYNDKFGTCPVCNNKFTQNDDIVVCPECGAPYHRECYNSLGQCKYKEKHSTDFSYPNPHINKKNEENENPEENLQKKCPRCLYNNTSDSLFCSNCGFPFLNNNTNKNVNHIPEVNPFNFAPFTIFDKNETINDIKISEFAEYIKNNVTYYLPTFKRIKENKKSRFNFSAFLFSGGWFLYRKLYKIGIILTSIVILLMISSAFIEFTYAQDILISLLNSAGISSNDYLTLENYNNLMTQISLLSLEKKIIISLPSILNLINFIIMLVSGFTANKIYLKDCTTKIKKIKVLCNDDEKLYSEEMKKHGGVNLKIVPFLLICYIIIEYLPRFLI